MFATGFHFGPSSVLNADAAELTWHRIVEAFKHAFSLRSRLGDNDIGSTEFIDEVDEVHFICIVFFYIVFK
jgi:hypothetical protein